MTRHLKKLRIYFDYYRDVWGRFCQIKYKKVGCIMGKVDPRILKTKKKLKTAFFELLATKKISEINVKDLTQKANVTRGTFYLHFQDKEAFVKYMMEETITDFFDSVIFERDILDGKIQPRLSLTHIFNFVDEQPTFFTVLLKEKDAKVYQTMISKIAFTYIERYNEATNNKFDAHVPTDLFMNYIIYGILGFVDQWLKEGKMYANHYMADNLHKLLDCKLIREAHLIGFFIVDGTNEHI